MDKASEAIFSLKPVTFHYKNDKTNIPQFGLIAEEVAKVNPALIAVDKEGKPYTVRYEAGQRDAAQRVSQRASQKRGTASDHHSVEVYGCKAGGNHRAAAKANCRADCGLTESERSA